MEFGRVFPGKKAVAIGKDGLTSEVLN